MPEPAPVIRAALPGRESGGIIPYCSGVDVAAVQELEATKNKDRLG